MNIMYIVGILLAVFFTVFGIVASISGGAVSVDMGNLGNFFDFSSVLITIGGTIAVVIACYP